MRICGQGRGQKEEGLKRISSRGRSPVIWISRGNGDISEFIIIMTHFVPVSVGF